MNKMKLFQDRKFVIILEMPPAWIPHSGRYVIAYACVGDLREITA